MKEVDLIYRKETESMFIVIEEDKFTEIPRYVQSIMYSYKISLEELQSFFKAIDKLGSDMSEDNDQFFAKQDFARFGELLSTEWMVELVVGRVFDILLNKAYRAKEKMNAKNLPADDDDYICGYTDEELLEKLFPKRRMIRLGIKKDEVKK